MSTPEPEALATNPTLAAAGITQAAVDAAAERMRLRRELNKKAQDELVARLAAREIEPEQYLADAAALLRK